jgi:endonuclease YncB( thermonuclease family)
MMDRTYKFLLACTLTVAIIAVAVTPYLLFGAEPEAAIGVLPVEEHPPVSAVPVEVISIHDADTLRVNVLLPFGITLRDKSIRAFGYDAWEVSRTRQTVKVTENEIVKGKAARAALAKLIETGTLYVVDSTAADPYGRTSAWLYVRRKDDGRFVSVAAYMKNAGHCRQ